MDRLAFQTNFEIMNKILSFSEPGQPAVPLDLHHLRVPPAEGWSSQDPDVQLHTLHYRLASSCPSYMCQPSLRVKVNHLLLCSLGYYHSLFQNFCECQPCLHLHHRVHHRDLEQGVARIILCAGERSEVYGDRAHVHPRTLFPLVGDC